MGIAARVRQSMAEGSWIRKMFEEGSALKQRYGLENVFDLSLGNPLMEPPTEFKRELRQIAENPSPGMHKYMENAGYPETRAAVAKQLSQETGIKFTKSDIVMTCGAAGASGTGEVRKAVTEEGGRNPADAAAARAEVEVARPNRRRLRSLIGPVRDGSSR